MVRQPVHHRRGKEGELVRTFCLLLAVILAACSRVSQDTQQTGNLVPKTVLPSSKKLLAQVAQGGSDSACTLPAILPLERHRLRFRGTICRH